MRWFAVEEDNSDDAKINGIEITDLVNLLAALRNAWRAPADGKPLIYSVEVMTLFGQVIAEVERLGGSVFEWEEETPTVETWNIGDLVCERGMFLQMNPPIVGRLVEYIGEISVGVLWSHREFPEVEYKRDLVKVGEEYERFAPPHADADSTAQ